MIFSQELCPLCGQKLLSEFTHVAGTPTSIFFKCPKYEIVRSNSNTAPIMKNHYTNEVFDYYYEGKYSEKPLGQICMMIIPPYVLDHSSKNNLTSVSMNRGEGREPQKLIFQAPLLDMDYSKTHIVIAKLKVLVTFS